MGKASANPDQNGTDCALARQRQQPAAPQQCTGRTEARQAVRGTGHGRRGMGARALARPVLSCSKRRQTRCAMKWLVAIIKPFTLEDVRRALADAGVNGMTVAEVRGFGRQRGHTELYRGAGYVVDFLPKLRIEVAVAEDQLDRAIEAISGAARTGKVGDGKIFVLPLEHVV